MSDQILNEIIGFILLVVYEKMHIAHYKIFDITGICNTVVGKVSSPDVLKFNNTDTKLDMSETCLKQAGKCLTIRAQKM